MTQNIQSAAVSDRGLSEKRPQNEDSFLELPSHGLFVVADGVGGAQAGDVASQMATEMLGEAFTNSDTGDVEELMKIAIEKANESIYQMSHDLPQLATMATTVVALHIADNIATIGHVGDSRLYRVDSRGNLFRETQDHSVVEEEVRAGRMTAAQAAHHPSKNVISRALGAEQAVEVDMKTIMFEPDTAFLLCSDGITRHIEDDEIRELLRSENTPSEIAAEMKNICYRRGAEDNLTAVIVRVAGESAAAEAEENTVATARPSAVGSAALANSVEEPTTEIPTQDLQMPVPANFETDKTADGNQFTIPANADSENLNNENTSQIPAVAATNYQSAQDRRIIPAGQTDSGLGKLLAGMVLGFLIGAGIVAAAYHFLSNPQPQVVQETPKITEMKSSDIPFSAFENNRRNVDRDPAKYIANGAVAEDAEDNYLLGRAYLLQGKYVDAKNAFIKAKELLPTLTGGDKTMLGNEIAIGLSIVDSGFSKSVLQKEKENMSSASNESSNTKTATNVNINANSNAELMPVNAQTNANN